MRPVERRIRKLEAVIVMPDLAPRTEPGLRFHTCEGKLYIETCMSRRTWETGEWKAEIIHWNRDYTELPAEPGQIAQLQRHCLVHLLDPSELRKGGRNSVHEQPA